MHFAKERDHLSDHRICFKRISQVFRFCEGEVSDDGMYILVCFPINA